MRYSQIKKALREAEIIDEVSMSPSALQQFANSPEAEGMLMGIEFEMCVPNAATDDDGGGEYDYDQNQSAYSIDEIINFFREGDYSTMGRSEADRLSSRMWEQFLDWQMEKISYNLDDDELNSRIRDRLESDYTVNDYVDAAREELGDDAPDDDVQGRAVELRDDAITEIINSADGRDYQYAYDNAREELEDEMRDDSDYDQEAWLNDIGIDDMQDAEREWGLDWPYMTYGGGGDLSVDDIGQEFGLAMGLDSVNTSSNYHGARRDGVRWIIEPDSSIDADEGDGGLEFVSPPMPIKDGLEMIEKMYKWARDNGCYTNKSTGLHMNISVPDMTIDNLDYVKLALFLGDEYVLKQFGREYNSYAKSAMSKIKDRIKPEEVPQVLAQMKQHLNSLASKTIHSGITDKYTSINTKSNYVEFRGPGGDYLDKDPFEIVNTVLRLAMSLRIATDPEAYKQEYAKKLYKLTEQEKDPDNAVKLFSQYAVGELPKEDLVARIKFARKGRELEKDKKAPVERLSKNPDVQRRVDNMPEHWRELLKNLGNYDEQSLDSTVNNLEAGEYDDELDPDEEVPLAIDIIKSELAWREAQSEQKAFWVYNKDGTGGMQLVYANNENEAIIKGGKQMGMKREDSIVKLKAEEKTEPLDLANMSEQEFNKQVNDLPTFTLSKFVSDIKTRETSSLETALRNTKTRNITGNLSAMNYEFLQAVIERELKRRETEGEPGEEPSASSLQVGTPEPANAQAVFDSLPNNWKAWLDGMRASNPATLQSVVDAVANGASTSARNLSTEQKDLVISRIQAELRRRGGEVDSPAEGEWPRPWNVWVANIQSHDESNLRNVRATMADAEASRTSSLNAEQKTSLIDLIDNEFRRRTAAAIEQGERVRAQQAAVLPSTWQAFVNNMNDYSDETLASQRARIVQGFYDSELNLAQASEVLEKIQDEQRRRSVDAIQGNPAQQELDFSSPDDETIDDVMGGDSDEAAVAQQSELINRDDPVTSNDPEAQSEDFEIRNPHTGSVVSMVRNGNLDYAIQKAREHEQDLGLEAGTLQVNRVGQTNESISMLRKLAGIN